MSPLWRDELRIVLCPDRVILARLGRGWRPRVLTKEVLPFQPGANGFEWQPSLDALADRLKGAKDESANAVVILSNHFVRYTLVRWDEQLTDPREQEALARICFQKTYGDLANDWTIRMSDEGYGLPCIACAIDRMLPEAIVRTLAPTRLRLTSIRPYFVAAFNQWRRRLGDTRSFLLVAEPGRVCAGLLGDEKWFSVRMIPILDNLVDELPELLHREALLAGLDSIVTSYLFAPEEPNFVLPAGAGIAVETLKLPAREGFSPYTDARFGMALSGLA